MAPQLMLAVTMVTVLVDHLRWSVRAMVHGLVLRHVIL